MVFRHASVAEHSLVGRQAQDPVVFSRFWGMGSDNVWINSLNWYDLPKMPSLPRVIRSIWNLNAYKKWSQVWWLMTVTQGGSWVSGRSWLHREPLSQKQARQQANSNKSQSIIRRAVIPWFSQNCRMGCDWVVLGCVLLKLLFHLLILSSIVLA